MQNVGDICEWLGKVCTVQITKHSATASKAHTCPHMQADFPCSQQRSFATPAKSVFSLSLKQMIIQSIWSHCFPCHRVCSSPVYLPSVSSGPAYLSTNSFYFPQENLLDYSTYTPLFPKIPLYPGLFHSCLTQQYFIFIDSLIDRHLLDARHFQIILLNHQFIWDSGR